MACSGALQDWSKQEQGEKALSGEHPDALPSEPRSGYPDSWWPLLHDTLLVFLHWLIQMGGTESLDCSSKEFWTSPGAFLTCTFPLKECQADETVWRALPQWPQATPRLGKTAQLIAPLVTLPIHLLWIP